MPFAINADWNKNISFPLEISHLLKYVQSDNNLLQEIAIDCLEKIRDIRVHDLAIKLLKEKGLNSLALGLLKNNYVKSDDEIICNLIKNSSKILHHTQMNMRDIFLKYKSKNILPALLRVYQKGECSYCRYEIVKAMEHCGVLSNEILNECLYDFYDDTRVFAKRIIAKRIRFVEKK
jgi:hypothetical protein